MKRRSFLSKSVLGVGGAVVSAQSTVPIPKRKKVAAVVTEYRWYTHADVICGRLLGGYSANNIWTPPRTQLVSVYRDQVPANDMVPDLAARHNFRVCRNISEALTLGGKKLAVDAVLFIAEQGQYPYNDAGQHLYPRFEMFSEILDIYEASGSSVPTYFDKHFSYDWAKAKAIFDRARRLKFPLLAGSSVPVSLRSPELNLPLETPIAEVGCVGHGELDAYGFHMLEAMQCLVERRKGGETGVREVELIESAAVWAWLGGQGAWATPLIEAAYAIDPNSKAMSLKERAKDPVIFRIQYIDGLKVVVLILTPRRIGRTVALSAPGWREPLRTLFSPATVRPLPHFDGLVSCIEEMFVTGKEQYPPERTLLTTGILSHLFDSRRAKRPVATPALTISYRAPETAWYQRA